MCTDIKRLAYFGRVRILFSTKTIYYVFTSFHFRDEKHTHGFSFDVLYNVAQLPVFITKPRHFEK